MHYDEEVDYYLWMDDRKKLRPDELRFYGLIIFNGDKKPAETEVVLNSFAQRHRLQRETLLGQKLVSLNAVSSANFLIL
ncbi:MAG: hypothetical protein IPG60_11285 [Bacteroidetes bacterium]|nr:hypothetical protein [Bacteroidota bacterium]MBP7399331.1 hypothetical protein [Chitinophagales bacterium]MBP9019620.1 hypothetical protein [Bacteroidales bacterium]MBK7109541.1 hypothetical protein [Bacteroidota bacterium]MBK8487722.1 hypothetical protein [Bacteroidota bacterium]